ADHFLYAFPAAGCGAAVCAPRWKAHLADGVVDSSVAVSGGVAYVGDFSGHLYAFTAAGCGAALCKPRWTGHGQSTELIGAPAAGCGAKTCKPLRSYNTGDGGAIGSATVSGGTVFATTQASPDPNTVGVVAAYRAAGCGKPRCGRLWTGVNFMSGASSPPAVAGGVVFVGK